MPRTLDGESQRLLRTLFGGGSALGLSDGQLLERFNARDGPSAERAFGAIVQRHGPMVLRVARSILRDRTLADDAFQAAFLALARRAGSLWVRDSIGPWLHAVTVRISTRMRADLARRRSLDDRAARLAPTSCDPIEPDDLGAAVHEEIARLPDRHRLPILLCLVEGLTHDQAADRLGWPVGTVRSRLARGRDRLRDRLSRRGLAPSMIPITLGIGQSASEPVAASLLAATSRAAVSITNGGLIAATGMVPAGAVAAAITVLKETSMIHRAMLILGLVTTGVLAAGATLSAQSRSELPPTTTPRPESPTPPPESESKSISRVYAVGDLIFRPQAERILSYQKDGTLTETVSPGLASFGPLIDLITSTVAPGTWTVSEPQGEGGSTVPDGSITPFHLNLSLIVRHSPEVHDQLIERLRQLRRIVGPLTTVEYAEEAEELRALSEPAGLGRQNSPSGELPEPAGLEPTRGPSHPDQSPLARPDRPGGGLAPEQSPLARPDRPGGGLAPLERSSTSATPKARHPAAPRRGLHSNYPIADPAVVVEDYPIADPAVVVEDVPTGRRTLDPNGLPGAKADDSARRIDALEQKLDAILEELRAIRKGDDR